MTIATAWTAVGVGLALAGCSGGEKRTNVETGAPVQVIELGHLEAHVQSLSKLLAREPDQASVGCASTAEYVAQQFQALGLQPGGTEGYFQSLPLRRTQPNAGKCFFRPFRGRGGFRLLPDKDYAVLPNPVKTEAGVATEAVFAGYGVTAPELDYDNYAGLNASGRIVALLSGAPPSFSREAQARYCRPSTVLNNAVAHGAVGVLVIRTPRQEQDIPWDDLMQASRHGWTHWLDSADAPQGAWAKIMGAVLLNRPAAEALFRGGTRTLDEAISSAEDGQPQGFELPGTVNIRTSSRFTGFEGHNVLGVLPGSDPTLRNEYVLYTAALTCPGEVQTAASDAGHERVRAAVSTTAILLEMARAFAGLQERPRRSVLFLASVVEGPEEVGPDYFAHNPVVAGAEIVTTIAIDRLLIEEALRDTDAAGAHPVGTCIWAWCGDAGQAILRSSTLPTSQDALAKEAQRDFTIGLRAANGTSGKE